tara:strand:+ start:240 stop:437 length:198 start_codon:yes stop_codon:yes gene_type:complete
MPVNKYASLPQNHYPVVEEQLTERIATLQSAIDSVREALEGEINTLEEQKSEAQKDLEFIRAGKV